MTFKSIDKKIHRSLVIHLIVRCIPAIICFAISYHLALECSDYYIYLVFIASLVSLLTIANYIRFADLLVADPSFITYTIADYEGNEVYKSSGKVIQAVSETRDWFLRKNKQCLLLRYYSRLFILSL